MQIELRFEINRVIIARAEDTENFPAEFPGKEHVRLPSEGWVLGLC